jgi:hypothetical protein
MSHPRVPTPFAALLAAVLAAACASAPRTEGDGAPAGVASRAQPLAPLAGGARVMVLPTRYLSVDPEVRWWTAGSDSAAALTDLDAAIRQALQARGVGADWVWPDAVRRSVARSAGSVTDPARWDAYALRRARAGQPLGVPASIHSQLRALGALHDARYALYPVEYTVAPEQLPAGQRGQPQAALRLALIDVRSATVDWAGSVVGNPVAGYSSALPAGIASRVADLVAPAR